MCILFNVCNQFVFIKKENQTEKRVHLDRKRRLRLTSSLKHQKKITMKLYLKKKSMLILRSIKTHPSGSEEK